MEDRGFPEYVNQFFMAVIVAIQQYLGGSELVPELLQRSIGVTVIDQYSALQAYRVDIIVGPFMVGNEEEGWKVVPLKQLRHFESGRTMYQKRYTLALSKPMSFESYDATAELAQKMARDLCLQYLREWDKE